MIIQMNELHGIGIHDTPNTHKLRIEKKTWCMTFHLFFFHHVFDIFLSLLHDVLNIKKSHP
jgi:hypothetical protein